MSRLSPFVLPAFLAALFAAARLFYIAYGPIDLSPDEAHYWEWSRHLDWSYYSKPPLVAWLIHLSTSLFGQTEAAVRLFAIVGQSLLAVLGFALARHYGNKTSAWLAFALLSLTPLLAAGGLLMTPDIACTILWVAALLILSHIDWHKSGQLKLWLALGITVGLAGLSKYTAGAFYPLLGLYLLADKNRRPWLLKPHPYLAGFASLLALAPVWWWNLQNNFISFRHVLGQAAGEARNPWWETFGNFLGSQLGVVGPVVFILLLMFWFKRGKENALWWFSAPLFIIFLIKALDAKVQANWPVLAVTTGLIGLAVWATERPWRTYTLYVGLTLSALLSLAAHDTNLLRQAGVNLSAKRDPLKPVMGWQTMAKEIDALRAPYTHLPILTTRYQTAGELAFYLNGQPNVLYLNPGYRRQNQYDLWPWPAQKNLEDVLYINEGGHVEKAIQKAYTTCQNLGTATGARGPLTYRKATVYKCSGNQGLQRSRPENY